MRRKMIVVVGAIGLAFGMVGCSDDDVNPDTGTSDMGVDMPVADAGVDSTTDTAPDTTADASTQYSVLIAIAEVEGNMTWKTPGPDAGPPTPTKLVSVQPSFSDPSYKPDFIDAPAPPNCYAYKWKGGALPTRSDANAGKLSITGHVEATYVDATATTPTPATLPKTIECTHTQLGTSGQYYYNCGLPTTAALVAGSWLTDTTSMEFNVAGGTEITAFKETGIIPPATLKPAGSFDLNKVDPSAGIKAEWETTTKALLVAIRIMASLLDKSEYAEIICSQIAAAGSKQIPQGALDLLPTPTDTNPLILTTSITGFNLKGTSATWGTYKVGAGRGSIGVSCRLASSACP